jgi:DNA-binding transcriptional regulator YhcF (GntR family)
VHRTPSVKVALDPGSAVPLYLQLKHHILHLISAGHWQPGAPIPSVRQMAAEVGLATATVQRAYGELQAQAILVGQLGRGVFVADLGPGPPDLAGERSTVLRSLLARSVGHACALGFSGDEIAATVRALLDSDGAALLATPTVVFVGSGAEVTEKYGGLLREALAGLDVRVETILLPDLERQTGPLLDQLEPIRCVVSLVGFFPDVRRLVVHRGPPLFGLVVELTEDTQQALVELPTDETIGVVAEERYLTSAMTLVRQYRGAEDRILKANARSRAAVGRVVDGCRIILHTLGSRQVLESRARPGTTLIELRFRPNAASLARLRALLASEPNLPAAGANGHAYLSSHTSRTEGGRRTFA